MRKSLSWEGFVKQVGLKEYEGLMDEESGESTQEDAVTGV